MISQGGKKILEKFVTSAKDLLMKSITQNLQQYYGIWEDGHTISIDDLPSQDIDTIHTAKMLRDRMKHLKAALPEGGANNDKLAVGQLIAEQAFTQLNRFCAIRMCEERNLLLKSVGDGYKSAGFQAFDAVAQNIPQSQYIRYKWYLNSVFDELSIELPAVFDRFSPYGLVFPDESTLNQLFELINSKQLSEWYDDANGTTVNFWMEDETLGWMFQNYNSLEERRKMREESNKPRNSREMAVRNQFFTPEYIVRFLTDNSLGRIWFEMTKGKSDIGEKQCKYMVRRPDEKIEERAIKEPTEILSLDPTCGSMHFGLYLYEVYEYIYMDAWDNHPELLHEFRNIHTRESFHREVPKLILENNIYGCEIDPRALQIAALSLWLRAQRSYSEQKIQASERPLITKSNLVLAEAMPGNKRLLNSLMEGMEKPMQNLIKKIWDKMQFVGEAGLLFKMEKEIDEEIEYLRTHWGKVNQYRYASLYDTDEEKAKIAMENDARRVLKENKEDFFKEITERLKEALQQLSAKLSEDEGYENALFSDDATRGFAFIELCQKKFDCIVMNPPFGEGSEHTSGYLDDCYPAWCDNLVCAFFDRMQEMLADDGRLGAIFDRSVFIRSTYEDFRKKCICGFVNSCADTGWGVLDANVETSTLVITNHIQDNEGVFFDCREITPDEKNRDIHCLIELYNKGQLHERVFLCNSNDFVFYPNTTVSYDSSKLKLFKHKTLEERHLTVRTGYCFVAPIHQRVFYELNKKNEFKHLYNGSEYTLFYKAYRDVVFWGTDGSIDKSHKSYRGGNDDLQLKFGTAYGKRGDIVDAHILKKSHFFTSEGIAIPGISQSSTFLTNSLINSIYAQYTINLFCGQHKRSGYMNLLPMPDYDTKQSDIERIVNSIIIIKRYYFSFDETNLEYHGLLSQLGAITSLSNAIESLQANVSADNERYLDLVRQNDDLWMDLANIDKDSDFRKTLNDYKSRRPCEELLSIDGASSQNIIDKKVIAQEIIQELVGIVYGRWDVAYAKGDKPVPEFGDVFDALPFMPVVSLDTIPTDYPIQIPEDGILSNDLESNLNLAKRVSDVIQYIWGDKGDGIEYELCFLIGCKNLQAYFTTPNGFFDYHFKRYTKSRRKAPIYWPLSTEDGSLTYWIYYPKLSKNTLPTLVFKLKDEKEKLNTALNATIVSHDKVKETDVRDAINQVESMMNELNRLIDAHYIPNHDDGVPVTCAPLVKLMQHTGWKNASAELLEKFNDGDYDWSHLAMSMFPARVTDKARKDWCMALTHGLEHICENKPKEKKTTKKKKPTHIQATINFE